MADEDDTQSAPHEPPPPPPPGNPEYLERGADPYESGHVLEEGASISDDAESDQGWDTLLCVPSPTFYASFQIKLKLEGEPKAPDLQPRSRSPCSHNPLL